MRQGWKLAACVAALAVAAAAAPRDSIAASTTPDKSSGTKTSYRQFTGYITALDKTSITVEKRGKKPETRVFVKDAGMRTDGEVGKNARVTVYYRDDGGKAIAHRVVAKQNAGPSGSGG